MPGRRLKGRQGNDGHNNQRKIHKSTVTVERHAECLNSKNGSRKYEAVLEETNEGGKSPVWVEEKKKKKRSIHPRALNADSCITQIIYACFM